MHRLVVSLKLLPLLSKQMTFDTVTHWTVWVSPSQYDLVAKETVVAPFLGSNPAYGDHENSQGV
jgi:hypothetical protein